MTILMALLVSLAQLWAQEPGSGNLNQPSSVIGPTGNPAASPSPAIEAKVIDDAANLVPAEEAPRVKEGAIADVQLEEILSNKRDLKPTKGVQDFFITKESKVDLDFQKLEVSQADRCFKSTPIGIIDGYAQDKTDPKFRDLGYQPDGSFRVAGIQNGTAQVILYRGKQPGSCNEIGEIVKIYRVTVSNEDLITLTQELKALIGGVEGIEIRIVGAQVVVEGNVLIPREMKRVLAVMAKYQTKPILNLVEISPLTLKLLGQKMEEEIAGGKDRNKDIKVKVVNGRFFLEGNVDKRVDRDTAEKICQSYISERYSMESTGGPIGTGKLEKPTVPGLSDCVMMVRIRQAPPQDPDPIISVRVDFVTLNRNFLKTFDFRWAPGLSLDGNSNYSSDTGKFLTTFTGTLANLFPKLDTLQKHGHARVLKSATVLVRDGDDASRGTPAEARLVETLNLAYVIPGTPGANGAAATPPTAGQTPVTTEIRVRARTIPGTADKLNVGIVATQTEVRDFRRNEPPTTLQNLVETQLVVPNTESAAIGGLIAERRNVSNGRDPTTTEQSSINVFKLDKSFNFTDEKSQFIIFVTPTKLRSTTEGTDQLKRKFRLRAK
jgi:pilus assembly protein CpaC